MGMPPEVVSEAKLVSELLGKEAVAANSRQAITFSESLKAKFLSAHPTDGKERDKALLQLAIELCDTLAARLREWAVMCPSSMKTESEAVNTMVHRAMRFLTLVLPKKLDGRPEHLQSIWTSRTAVFFSSLRQLLHRTTVLSYAHKLHANLSIKDWIEIKEQTDSAAVNLEAYGETVRWVLRNSAF